MNQNTNLTIQENCFKKPKNCSLDLLLGIFYFIFPQKSSIYFSKCALYILFEIFKNPKPCECTGIESKELLDLFFTANLRQGQKKTLKAKKPVSVVEKNDTDSAYKSRHNFQYC